MISHLNIQFHFEFFLFSKGSTHLLRTHLVMEAFAVAAWRQLPSIHPVFQTLFPHLRTVMAINNFIRNDTAGNEEAMQYLNKSYKTFKFGMLSLPEMLKERGVDDPEKLPKFYYRWFTWCDFISMVVLETLADSKFLITIQVFYIRSNSQIKTSMRLISINY